MDARDEPPAPPEPTRWTALLFLAKAKCFQARRLWQDCRRPVRRHRQSGVLAGAPVIAEWSSDLWRDGSSPRERLLQLGKVQNLRVAARALNGIEVPANATWSFWRQLGRTTKAKGYSEGRELREGCLIPQIGGGLCQLSGAIYNAALEAGLEVVERHAHSMASVGSLARIGRDATVFWNYVDLRLRAATPWRMEVALTADQLQVRIRCRAPIPKAAIHIEAPGGSTPPPNTCATCGLAGCHRSTPLASSVGVVDRTAVLGDECQPEWNGLFGTDRDRSTLVIPLDGRRWGKSNYAWDTSLHGHVRFCTLLALKRSWHVRRLRAEGARRQRELLAWDARMADAFAKRLSDRHSHVTVAQGLLPHLWRRGHLGGRSFDVLMSRFPLGDLHRRLDDAAALHPESGTCADFRADDELVALEAEALATARSWITPHREIAVLAGPKARLLDWRLPAPVARHPALRDRLRVAFPASTLCRKGAFELRAALRELPVELVVTGGILEGADFWSGIAMVEAQPDWLCHVDAVALPAFLEHRPRALLRAIASGVPVIATAACGVEGMPGVTTVPAGDAAAVRQALEELHLTHLTRGGRHVLATRPD
jgi:hypothetical protein